MEYRILFGSECVGEGVTYIISLVDDDVSDQVLITAVVNGCDFYDACALVNQGKGVIGGTVDRAPIGERTIVKVEVPTHVCTTCGRKVADGFYHTQTGKCDDCVIGESM